VNKIRLNKFVLLLTSVTCFAAAYLFNRPGKSDHSNAISDFETQLRQKEILLATQMDSLAKSAEKKSYADLFKEGSVKHSSLFENEGIILLLYENDTLKFWTDNSMAVENYIREICLDDNIAQLRNGWFEVMRKPSKPLGTKVVIGLILLKKEYPYQNQYLVNEFQKDFSLNSEVKILKADASSSVQVKTRDDKYLCTLVFPAELNDETRGMIFSVWLNIFALIFILLYLHAECNVLKKPIGIFWSTIILLCSLILLRFLSVELKFPQSLYELPLFGPQHYGDANSFWLPSLGDFLLNSIISFFIIWYVCSSVKIDEQRLRNTKFPKWLIAFLLLLILFMFSRILNNLFIGLIQNSNISFNVNDLFSLDVYSYVALLIISLLLFSFFLAADKIIAIIRKLGLKIRDQIIVFVSAIALYTIIAHLLGLYDLITILWPAVLIVAIIRIRRTTQNNYVFSGIAVLVFIVTFYSVHTLIKWRELKEKDGRRLYAEKLASEQDPLAEHLFTEVEEKIKTDTSILSSLKTEKENFGKYFVQKYFSGYWDKYDVRVSVFDTMCYPIFSGSNPSRDNHTYFEETIKREGSETESSYCFYIPNVNGKISYLARIPIYFTFSSVRYGDLYLELDSRFVSEEIGFPELLLDKEIGLNRALANYSYAKYKNNQLINKFGKFQYVLNSANYSSSENGDFLLENFENNNHLFYRTDKNTLVILSKKDEGFLGRVTTFSYLFAFFSLFLTAILFSRQLYLGLNFSQISFKYRIQFLLVMIVLASLVLFGSGTIYYIKKQYEEKNIENISEKLQSVLIEVEGKMGNETILTNSLSEYATYVLKKFSNVFFTDINLYDSHGNLYASSRPKLFDEGLTSKKMNPKAFLNMTIYGKTEFIHDENIGKLNYLSAYVPFKNKDGKLMGYLNLPYFAKQSELEKEISTFLVALINIYVLLFGLSIIVAIFISSYLTKPLKLIQEKLGKVKLGKTNEPIEWKQNDEIGSLVSEYNRMILELQNSAVLLAKSERETAWREMAKQVAHEIKNPLTPMKLSVQHMERLINDKSPNLEEKIKKLSKTLVEQIETLSTIANEFSNFAKMPKANNEKIYIKSILQNAIHLFKNSENAEFIFNSDVQETTSVFADKEQLVRVFNNLIKNAIQAIPEDRKAVIEIDLKKENATILIRIKDNGSGISDDIMDRIFAPNFTTKSTGMGLGLAMVKNIVESCNGKIWFETTKDKGTTFFVSLPEYKD